MFLFNPTLFVCFYRLTTTIIDQISQELFIEFSTRFQQMQRVPPMAIAAEPEIFWPVFRYQPVVKIGL